MQEHFKMGSANVLPHDGWTPFSGDMEGTNAQDKSKSVDRHCYKRLCSSMILSKPPGGE